MKIEAIFNEDERQIEAAFTPPAQMPSDFGEICVVERVDIPKQYGLITYDQNKTITVT